MNKRATTPFLPAAPAMRTARMEKILDCAEREFAARGYKATPLHRIAAAAKVNQALINYYFASKEKLYEAIFLRRGLQLSKERLRRLDELQRRATQPPAVEELIESFLTPALDLLYQEKDGKSFLKLQARLQSEPKEITAKLRATVYDGVTTRYIEQFKLSLPHVDADAIVWRMVMMLGSYLYIASDPNRLTQLSAGACDIRDQREVLRQLSAFLTGGFKHPLAKKRNA